MIAGDSSFAHFTLYPILSNVPIHFFCVASVPLDITAAGVSGLLPALISSSAICSTCASPIRNTQVMDSSVSNV